MSFTIVSSFLVFFFKKSCILFRIAECIAFLFFKIFFGKVRTWRCSMSYWLKKNLCFLWLNCLVWHCSIIFVEIFFEYWMILFPKNYSKLFKTRKELWLNQLYGYVWYKFKKIAFRLLTKNLEFHVIKFSINGLAIFFCLYDLLFLEILLKVDWLIIIDWSFTGIHWRAENFIVN